MTYPIYAQTAKNALQIEADTLRDLANHLDEQAFGQAIDAILHCQGRLVVIGIGKSGHIARKIAATLASTGTPAFFVHPSEAAHGDLGMIMKDDVVLALSYSGESDEVLSIVPALKRKGVCLIVMSGRSESTLAQTADIFLNVHVKQEACPLGLAPTSSTTASLALGDALAVVLLQARNLTADDFALSHPAGRLGKRLIVRVSDIMHQNEHLPVVSPDLMLPDAIVQMSEKGMGMILIAKNRQLIGIFTDGDLRRLFQKNNNLPIVPIQEVMKQAPHSILASSLASEALRMMQEKRINGMAVVDEENRLIGAINMHDLMQAGVL
ncbi:MAG: KpsF/GutQ family sugar-phosphate isomerase [Neisseriaceae bacterium]|nr:KpsF/GutQ family sugar-phosphate isomerase [Neisseriaceae bacterium]